MAHAHKKGDLVTGALHPHEYSEYFPMIEGQAFDDFCESIKRDGLLEPIILYNGKILDGRNRYRACRKVKVPLHYGIEVKTFNGSDKEALDLVSSLNINRRHLTDDQRAMAAAKMANALGGRISNAERDNVISLGDAAAKMRVPAGLVADARKVRKSAPRRVVRMVEQGKVSVNAARTVTKLPEDEQKKLRTADAVNDAARDYRDSFRQFQKRSPAAVLDIGMIALEELTSHRTVEDTVAGVEDAAAMLSRVEAARQHLTLLSQALLTKVSA